MIDDSNYGDGYELVGGYEADHLCPGCKTDHLCPGCKTRPGSGPSRDAYCDPCMAEHDEERQRRNEQMDALKAKQEAELTRVEAWVWDRLVMPERGRRRQREHLTVYRHPTGWISNLGFETVKPCQSVWDYTPNRDMDVYRAFHAEHPPVWKVVTVKGRYWFTEYWCDAHLPETIRTGVLEHTA